MSDTQTSVIQSPTPKNPTLEESLAELQKQGAFPGENTEEPEGVSEDVDGDGDERPEWLPEKFSSPEDLAKAYAELEKKLGKKTDDPADDTATAEANEAAEEAVEKAGLDMSGLEAEYLESGKLSDKSLKALEAVGISRSMVDAHIKGLEAQQQVYETQVVTLAGGTEAYTQMIEWAGKNFSEDEIGAYDEAVNSFDMKKAKFAVESLKARYSAAFGQAPSVQVDGRTAATAGGYESTEQMLSDMQDPRYHQDPAFRAKVEKRIKASRSI